MILIENLDYIATFDDDDSVVENGSILIDGPAVAAVGSLPEERPRADTIIDGSGKMALPGFVNTHHHFFQQLTRAMPSVHRASILDWLRTLYPIWACIDEEIVHHATLLAGAQLLKTGCTTTSDMAYFYPFGRTNLIDAEIAAARELGIRFHPCRATLVEMEGRLGDQLSAAGLPVSDLVEDKGQALQEFERVVHRYHDSSRFSMCQVAIGQTDKTYRDPDFMHDMAALADSCGVLLHTHLHPREDELALCRELHGQEPVDFLADTGWLGPHTWFAHATAFDDHSIERVAEAGAGVSHSPSSNMRLAYGAAPVPAMAAAGIDISVAVDGGASNDTGDYLGELRQAFLMHRIRGLHPAPYDGVNATEPHQLLRIGTRGGAAVLNRDDLGSLETGKAADIVLYDMTKLDFAGGLHDPLAALILCGESHIVDTTIVNGEILVQDGELTRLCEADIADGANQAAAKLIDRASRLTN